MRSLQVLRKSKILLRLVSNSRSTPQRPVRSSRRIKDAAGTLGRAAAKRQVSTGLTADAPPQPPDLPEGPEDEGAPTLIEISLDENEKPKRRTRTTLQRDGEPQLPPDLDILWTADSHSESDHGTDLLGLPPPEMFEEALHNLLLILHPQTQHRGTYTWPAGSPVEPTLALYCPVEGGEYIIDQTVREMARRTGSEVITIDSAQLAAGEFGCFGKAASALQLPHNPLHFIPTTAEPKQSNHPSQVEDVEMGEIPHHISLVMSPGSMATRSTLVSSARRSNAPSKLKIFFDELVNLSPKAPEGIDASPPRRPRIIYIRDYSLIASSSSLWYPVLLSAVRQRRQGPISRPTSPISNPTVIVFGITPPLTPSAPQHSTGPSRGIMSLLMSRNSPPGSPSSIFEGKHGKQDWNEEESSEKAREKRLRNRLRRWEKGDGSHHRDIPLLGSGSQVESSGRRPGITLFGPSGGILSRSQMEEGQGGTNMDSEDSFFRISVLLPATRSPPREKSCRISRRREINELAMRMGIGAIGGVLGPRPNQEPRPDSPDPSNGQPLVEALGFPEKFDSLWENWGKRIEEWSTIREIADRAVGGLVSETSFMLGGKPSLDPTLVPWLSVCRAWASHRTAHELRKSWSKSLFGVSVRDDDLFGPDEEGDVQQDLDDVLERVKQDPDLEPHEQRLLPCIVNPRSIPTTFNQVHLPSHTIDSVRTIVSLPLLYPGAFQKGILKEHGMTGCLLFGPPGTGKTLVVRALAKEAGCRMMVISPSDVMDMYVGEGEKLVRAVFSLARRLSPCVVFLDEIDALFGARMSARESGGAFAHRGVITEFMQEMDGLKSSKEDSVIVIGATNRPFDLDDAVLRRLPRRLLVDLPGVKEREAILKILLRDENLADDLDLGSLAKKAESFSGSDLKHLCVAAALDAVKERVEVPWKETALSDRPTSEPDSSSTLEGQSAQEPVSHQVPPLTDSPSTDEIPAMEPAAEDARNRILSLANFTKALKEITPSSSESLGTLSDLRKWNEEFGEGRKDKRKRQVWGKDRFGFINNDPASDEGRVLPGASRGSPIR